jgi:flagellar biosynthesis protein FlhB
METKSKDKLELYYDTNAQPKINEFLAAQIEERRFKNSLLKKLKNVDFEFYMSYFISIIAIFFILLMLFTLKSEYGSDSIITVSEITVHEFIGIIMTVLAIFVLGICLSLGIYCMFDSMTEKSKVRKEIKQEYEAKYGKNIFDKDNL